MSIYCATRVLHDGKILIELPAIVIESHQEIRVTYDAANERAVVWISSGLYKSGQYVNNALYERGLGIIAAEGRYHLIHKDGRTLFSSGIYHEVVDFGLEQPLLGALE